MQHPKIVCNSALSLPLHSQNDSPTPQGNMKGKNPHKAAVDVGRKHILGLNQTQRLVPPRSHTHPHPETLRYGNQEVLLAQGVKPQNRHPVFVATNQIDNLLGNRLLREK